MPFKKRLKRKVALMLDTEAEEDELKKEKHRKDDDNASDKGDALDASLAA